MVVVLVGLVLVLSRLPGRVDADPADQPAGYKVVSTESLDAGVEHVRIRSDDPAQDVQVARLAPGTTSRLQTVLAANVLTGPASGLDTTSSMCARVGCLAGVNAGFVDQDRQPVGAMISGGELITTPGIEHAYLLLPAGGGRPSVGPDLPWSARLTVADRKVVTGAVNRPQSGDEPVLYTPRWGPTTGTDASTTELVAEISSGTTGAVAGGDTALRLVALRAGGNSPIGRGQVVLAGRGASAAEVAAIAQFPDPGNLLTKLLNIPTAPPVMLSVSTDGVRDTAGGSPLLLVGGELASPFENEDSFTQDRHPRTMVGITASGETLLVTADGRQPGHSAGLTLVEAAELMSGLGAVDAINLDGGGSTTFVTGTQGPSGPSERRTQGPSGPSERRTQVRNQPSDAAGERPVISALVLLPSGSASQPLSLSTPVASSGAAPPLEDPASRPPNLLGDLLPPLQRALAPNTEPLEEALEPVIGPEGDNVSKAVEDMLRAVQSGIQGRQ